MTETLDLEKLRELAEKADKVAPGQWEHDTDQNDGAYGAGPNSRHGFASYFMMDDKGRRLFDSYNSEVAEVHEEDEGAWDENSRRLFDFLAAVSPKAILALVSALSAETAARERVESENKALRGIRPLQGDDMVAMVKAHRAKYGSDLTQAVQAVRSGWTTATEWQDAFIRATQAEARVVELEKVLKPFAGFAERIPDVVPNAVLVHAAFQQRWADKAFATIGEFRAANTALSPACGTDHGGAEPIIEGLKQAAAGEITTREVRVSPTREGGEPQ